MLPELLVGVGDDWLSPDKLYCGSGTGVAVAVEEPAASVALAVGDGVAVGAGCGDDCAEVGAIGNRTSIHLSSVFAIRIVATWALSAASLTSPHRMVVPSFNPKLTLLAASAATTFTRLRSDCGKPATTVIAA